MIDKSMLNDLYVHKGLSMKQLASQIGCSPNQVAYWMNKYGIRRRSISEAIYLINNPNGDPFEIQQINSIEKAKLFGLGIGLYWGEGNRANKYSIRIGNTDPELIKIFMKFLIELFAVNKNDIKFGLQIFTDINPQKALEYWTNTLNIAESQFYKLHITPSGSIGNYKNKSKYGVLTLYYHKKKLRDILVGYLPR
ncbi:MAG: hypothetical protein WCQ49_00395 [Candidatus Saccharibacteria bacterium]